MVGQLLNRCCPVYGGGFLIARGALTDKICTHGQDSENFACICLNSAGWSVFITWNVKSRLKAPLEAEKGVTWSMGLIGGLAYGRITVLVSKSFAQGILARCFKERVLHDAAESI